MFKMPYPKKKNIYIYIYLANITDNPGTGYVDIYAKQWDSGYISRILSVRRPPQAQWIRLLSQSPLSRQRRCGIYYQSLIGNVKNRWSFLSFFDVLERTIMASVLLVLGFLKNYFNMLWFLALKAGGVGAVS